MKVSIGKAMFSSHAVVMDDDGLILGILKYEAGQDITPLLVDMLLDNYDAPSPESISFDEEVIQSSGGHTTLEGTIVREGGEERFELSFYPTGVYQAEEVLS